MKKVIFKKKVAQMWNECICVLLLCILRSGGLNNNKRQVENKSKGNKTKKKKKKGKTWLLTQIEVPSRKR